MDGKFETTPCPLCGEDDHVLKYDFSPYRVVQCTQCSLHYVSPRLTEEAMLDFYRSGDYYGDDSEIGYSAYQQQEKSLRQTFRAVLRRLQRQGFTGGDLLELGCGWGYFLDEATPYYRSRTGTDYSQLAVEKASASGAEVIKGGLAELHPDTLFDSVVLIQVLEHIYDPVPFLETARTKLRPGGNITVVVPDWNTPFRWLLGKKWPAFKHPEHVCYYTNNTLGQALDRAGFTGSKTIIYNHAFPLSMYLDLFGLKVPEWLGQVSVWIPFSCAARVAWT